MRLIALRWSVWSNSRSAANAIGRYSAAVRSNSPQQISKSTSPAATCRYWLCGPCKMMAPAFEQAAQQLEPRVRAVKVNTEAEQALGAQFGIRSIPTLALFKGGQEVARQAGAMGAVDIVRWTQAQL